MITVRKAAAKAIVFRKDLNKNCSLFSDEEVICTAVH